MLSVAFVAKRSISIYLEEIPFSSAQDDTHFKKGFLTREHRRERAKFAGERRA